MFGRPRALTCCGLVSQPRPPSALLNLVACPALPLCIIPEQISSRGDTPHLRNHIGRCQTFLRQISTCFRSPTWCPSLLCATEPTLEEKTLGLMPQLQHGYCIHNILKKQSTLQSEVLVERMGKDLEASQLD